MTVTSTDNKVTYLGDGATDAFPFSFKVYEETDLLVERILIADGTTTTGVKDTDYTVTLNDDGTGTVTTIGTWENTSSSYKIVIRRVLPLTQLIDLEDNESTPADTFEEGYDRAIMICQQLQEQLDRAILQISSLSASLSLPLPVANYLLGWNSGGTALENKAPADSVLPAPTVADAGKYVTVDGSGAYVLTAGGGSGGATVTRVTFVSGDLVAGALTVTHSKGLTAPYGVVAFIFDNNYKQIVDAEITGATNSFEIDLTDFEVIGTWEVVYLA